MSPSAAIRWGGGLTNVAAGLLLLVGHIAWSTAACYDALWQTDKKLSEMGRPWVELVSRSTQEIRGLQWQVQTQGVLVLRALQHHRKHSAGVDRRPAWHPRLLCGRRVAKRDLQPGGPHPYFGRDRKEAPRHRSLGLVDTDRFGATDRSDSALGVRLAGRHAGRQPVWPEPERGHSQGGLRSVVRRTHPSAWKGYSANFALTAFSEVQCSLSALEHIHDPQIGVCCVCYVASWRRVKAQDSYLPFQHS